MPPENRTPDLPDFDPNADRGDAFAPTDEPTSVGLTDAELTAIGKEPQPADNKKDEAKAEEKKDGEPAAEEKKDDEPAAEETKDGEKVDKDEQPRDEKGKFIPKARFDEVNRKAKARVAELERQNADLRARVGVINGEMPDVKELEKQLDTRSEEYGKLIADGDLAKANEVMREINKLNRQLGMVETLAITSSHVEETANVSSLSQLVDLYKAEYPVFDDNSNAYSQDYVNFVADLQGRFEATGSSPAEALRLAVELTVARFGLDTTEAAPAAASPKSDKAAERKSAEVKKSVAAAAAQPAALDKVGADSDKTGLSKVDVGALSFDEFCKLPEQALSRLRGDLV